MTSLAIWFSILLIAALSLLIWPLVKTNNAIKPSPKAIYTIALFVPIFSMALYFSLGTPQFAEITHSDKTPEVISLVDKLEQKLKKNPGDFQGWLMLGRSYMVTNEIDKAISAYEKALKLNSKSLDVLLPLADALAVKMQGNLLGRPYHLLQTAYQIDSDHHTTLWLLGIAEKQRGNKEKAAEHWGFLYQQLPAEDPDKKTIAKLLKSLNREENAHKLELSTPPAQQRKPENDSNNQVKITIHFDPEILPVLENKTLFLYAKEPNGRPMPIAAKQLSIDSFKGKKQISFTLTSKDAILPDRQLEQFTEVLVGYRISDAKNIEQARILYQHEAVIGREESATFIIKP